MTSRPAKNSSPASHGQKWHDPVQVIDQWCIYRIPSRLRNVNEAAYTPQVISIGPFHHGNPKLRDMESHKEQYFKKFSKRSPRTKPELRTFMRERKDRILLCYAGVIEGDVDFSNVILVDACFLIELFLRNWESEGHERDYILRSPLLKKAVEQDLILFENQIPYALLEELYNFAIPASSRFLPSKEIQEQVQEQHQRRSSPSHDNISDNPCFQFSMPPRGYLSNDHIEFEVHRELIELTIAFFQEYTKRHAVEKGFKPKHFTDLVRHFLCPEEKQNRKEKAGTNYNLPKSMNDVRKLSDAAVKFRPNEGSDRFIIKKDEDRKCSFRLPCLRTMDLKLTRFYARYEVECVLRNVMALEQLLYPKAAYVCSYFLLLDQLVDTVEDVNLLVDNGVIVNMLGSSKAVVRLINSLSEQITDSKSCYADICEQLNHHHKVSVCNRNLAALKRVFFKNLWTGSSTILGIFVLVFSIIGTIKSLMF